MYILRNAAKNLLRNKGRNMIIAIIMLAMLTTTAVSIIINTTTGKIIEDYKTRFGSEVFMNLDPQETQKAVAKGERVPEITFEQKLDFSNSEYLKETFFKSVYPAYAPNLSGIGQKEAEEQLNKPDDGGAHMEPVGGDDYHFGNLCIMSFSDNSQLEEFISGARKITSGNMYQADNECIIGEDFAKLNDLKIGDTIEIVPTNKKLTSSLKLTVVGIYFDGTKDDARGTQFNVPIFNRKNEILTNLNTILKHGEALEAENTGLGNLTDVVPKYILKSPDYLDAFTQEVRSKGLPQAYNVTTDQNNYDKIVKPVEGVAKTTTIFLILVLTIGGTILMLLSTLAIRERKYEIGVLRAMGMKRHTVARSLIYETIMIISVCLVIGLSIGGMVAEPVSEMIIQDQIEASNTDNGNGASFIVGAPAEAGENPLTSMEVSLTYDAIAQVTIIALFIGLLSSAAGLLYILRYEPMKILSERN